MSSSKPAFVTTLQEALLKHLRGPRSRSNFWLGKWASHLTSSGRTLAASAGQKILARTVT